MAAAAMLTGIGSMLVMIALASRAEIVGLVVVSAASALIYIVQRRFK